MKKKTEQQLRDIKPISAGIRTTNTSVDTIADADKNNGCFLHRREYLTEKLNSHFKDPVVF